MADENDESKNIPACAIDFVNRLVKKMRYRRKVREEVRAELTAHFEDELQGCTSDEEKDKRARQLITEFGDMKLLAILLRRAKRRCRPLWRTVVTRTFQAIGVFIMCLILYGVWFSLGKPTIRVDYIALLNQMNQPQVRNEDNAWPHYEKAFKLFVPQSQLVKQFISYRRYGADREDAMRLKGLLRDNQQQIQAWLQENQKHWDNLSREQQGVLLKCLEYDWVPFLQSADQSYTDWKTTTMGLMTEHILRCIKEDTKLTEPYPAGTLTSPMDPGFPSDELKRWLENRTIPPNNLEAVSVAVLREAIKRFTDLPDEISAQLTDVECEYIGRWIAQNEAAWREFAAGSAKSYCYRPYTYDPNDKYQSTRRILLPHLASLKELARLGMWRSRVDQSQGRIQQSIDDCLAIARAARHWQGKGTFVEQLVGLAIGSLGHEEILHIVNTQRLSAADLRGLQQQLSQIYSEGFPLMNTEGERLSFMDVVQRSFTDGGPGGGHLIPGMWDEFTDFNPPGRDADQRRLFMPLVTAVSMAHAGRDATIAKANEIYDRQGKIAGMTPYERRAANLKTTNELMQESWRSQRFFLILLLMPATERASEIVYRGKVSHEAMVTILAVKRWRLEKGQYPAALGDLVSAGLLKEVPADPYSGKPLVYKKTGDDFSLYSVGQNFADDGGEVFMKNGQPRKWGTAEAGDTVFWPVVETQLR